MGAVSFLFFLLDILSRMEYTYLSTIPRSGVKKALTRGDTVFVR